MNNVNLRSGALAGFVLLASCASSAVTLGPARGTALIGRTLDLTIPARLDRGEDAATLCIEAELAYSETGIDSRKLTIVTTAGESGQANIRVTSTAIVDEPVVNLLLRAGCSVKNSRRYVLLADLPVDLVERPVPGAPVSAAANGATARNRPLVQDVSPVPAGPVRGGVSSAPRSRTTAAAPRQSRDAPLSGQANNRSGVAASGAGLNNALSQSLRLGESTSRNPGASRLQLDSADLSADKAPSLKSSAQLQTPPAETDARRSEFAALWRTLNLRPEEVTRDLQRLEEVQSQTRSLRETNSKSQAELSLAREQLKNAEAERFANPLVYALAALLALLLLIAVFLYLRSRRSSHSSSGAAWWDLRESESVGRRGGRTMHDLMEGPSSVASPVPVSFTEDASKDRLGEDPLQAGMRPVDSNYPPSGMAVSPRGVNVNELFDIAQQADFFVSLGQHDHAIEVLSNHIRENDQTSPLAYLDLFKIFHELGRKPQYDELRLEFNRIFNAEVPPFDDFRERGEGLEAYESAITRIQSLWSTPKVLEVIEESIFRKPGRQSDAFGLEAYRELLLLYAIAHELVDIPQNPQFESSNPRSLIGTASASNRDQMPDYATELQPLGSSMSQGRIAVLPPTMPAALVAERAGSFSLDIDLSEPWMDLGYSESDSTVVLPVRKPNAFQPPSSAWLDFDLSEIKSDIGESGEGAQVPPGTSRGNPNKGPDTQPMG